MTALYRSPRHVAPVTVTIQAAERDLVADAFLDVASHQDQEGRLRKKGRRLAKDYAESAVRLRGLAAQIQNG